MTGHPELRVADRGSVPVAHFAGDLDASTAVSLHGRLLKAVQNRDVGLVMDLSDTRYVDSAGINLLFELAELLQARQLALAVVVPEGGLVERVLSMVDLSSVAGVHRSVDAAVHAILAGEGGP
jgi:anti-anti-sigma factor